MTTLNNNTYTDLIESRPLYNLSLDDVKDIKYLNVCTTLYITMENAECLLDQDPEIFDGLNIELY